MARYIDADALISEIEKTIKVNKSPHYEMRYWEDGMTCAIDIIENAPTADVVEPKKGEWIEHPNYVECNKCHFLSMFEGNYCPNCGARMVSE